MPTVHRIGTATDRAARLPPGRLDNLSCSPKLSLSIIPYHVPLSDIPEGLSASNSSRLDEVPDSDVRGTLKFSESKMIIAMD